MRFFSAALIAATLFIASSASAAVPVFDDEERNHIICGITFDQDKSITGVAVSDEPAAPLTFLTLTTKSPCPMGSERLFGDCCCLKKASPGNNAAGPTYSDSLKQVGEQEELAMVDSSVNAARPYESLSFCNLTFTFDPPPPK